MVESEGLAAVLSLDVGERGGREWNWIGKERKNLPVQLSGGWHLLFEFHRQNSGPLVILDQVFLVLLWYRSFVINQNAFYLLKSHGSLLTIDPPND